MRIEHGGYVMPSISVPCFSLLIRASADLIVEQQPWDNLYDGLLTLDTQQEAFPLPKMQSLMSRRGQQTLVEEMSSELDSHLPAPQVCYGMIRLVSPHSIISYVLTRLQLYRTAAHLCGEMSHLDSRLHSPDVPGRQTITFSPFAARQPT